MFLAARFDASAAVARHQVAGDGTPVQITIPTPNPWVPLHILALAKPSADVVQADVYLLTDRMPSLLGLDGGVTVQVSEPASPGLLDDLRSDKDSQWVPQQAWLTFVRVETPAAALVHDLAIDASGAGRPSLVQAGYNPLAAPPSPVLASAAKAARDNDVALPAAAVAIGVSVTALTVLARRKRHVSVT